MKQLALILLIATTAMGDDSPGDDHASQLKLFSEHGNRPELWNAQPQREYVSLYSRGHDDFNGTMNYRTAHMASSLVVREGFGEPRLTLNFNATLGTSQAAAALQAEAYFLREVSRRYRPGPQADWTPTLFDEKPAQIHYADSKFSEDKRREI